MMTKQEVALRIPPGQYKVTIKVGAVIPVGKKGKTLDLTLSSSTTVELSDQHDSVLEFENKEKWWDILFTIDLLVWLATCFLTIPSPWNLVYHILSDGFFAVWLIRLYLVRRNYFSLSCN